MRNSPQPRSHQPIKAAIRLAVLLPLPIIGLGFANGLEAQTELMPFQVTSSSGQITAGTNGSATNDLLGTSLISAERDFNSDGFDDVYVGVPGAAVGSSPSVGQVILVSGRDGTELQVPPIEVTGLGTHALFGFSLAAIDTDGDGIKELAVGAPGPGAESVYVYELDGRGRVLGGGPTYTLASVAGAFGFSLAVGRLEDPDPATCQDQSQELIVGAPGRELPLPNNEDGRVFAFDFLGSGISQVILEIQYDDNRADNGARAGYRVASYNYGLDTSTIPAGESCLDEIVVTAPYSWRTIDERSAQSGAAFAVSMQAVPAALPFPVVIVDRSQHKQGDPQFDPVRWFYTALAEVPSRFPMTEFGSSLSIIPDPASPGRSDVVVGARLAYARGPLHYGSAVLIDGEKRSVYQDFTGYLGRYNGASDGDFFGTYAAAIDINTDGTDDLAIGAAGYDSPSGPNRGGVFVFPGTRAWGVCPPPGSPVPRVPGLQDPRCGNPSTGNELFFMEGLTDDDLSPQHGGERSLFALSEWASQPNFVAIPDVNCDGRPELLVGAPRADSGGHTDNGSVLLYGQDNPSPAPSPPGLCGDCDGSGTVNILDSLAMSQMASGVIPPPAGTAAVLCNVFGSQGSGITMEDALLTAQFAAGVVSQLVCGLCP